MTDSRTVFVGALDPSVSEAQLASVFAPFGELSVVKIPFNKMCGFVEYHDGASAAQAIAAMNGTVLGNGRIRCMLGIAKPERARAAAHGGGGGGGGYHAQAAASSGYAPAPAAASYHAPHATSAWSSSASAAIPSDPYTIDQDDARAEPLWPNRGVDLCKRNDAFVSSRADLQMMRVGLQLSTVDNSSWMR